ncbi:histidine kinase dimerization/phospho-acceptor domain-containing protein [Parerythrobacter aurantius]|uniref:sensor histidine kinase n=1 Tax=Parerythrobacter aurantius TaxID=3127706 RepID=UPI003245F3E4
MHFDDRLATVLRHRAGGARAARTQYRQLLDLLGQRRHGRDESLLAAAWLRLGALGETIPAADRAAIVREPGVRFGNPELAAHLAEDEPAVAAAALAAAHLTEDDWTALIPRLPVRARGFLRLRRDLPEGAIRVLDRLGVSDLALPLPRQEEPLVLTEETEPEQEPDRGFADSVIMPFPANDAADPLPRVPGRADADREARPTAIAALVERIEAFQRNRSETRDVPAVDNDTHPPLPFVELEEGGEDDSDAGIVFTTDVEGRIDWADEAVAAMLRYLPLTESVGRDARRAMQRRLPLVAVPATLEGAPSIAGQWLCDAAPRFDEFAGRFLGYAGRLRRVRPRQEAPDDHAESDRIRQLLHELRTPVNAIQGFAEVIQQQLFGPVPHEYRALAAGIAGDAARILAGFEELDRLAKLESGAKELDSGDADFSAVVAAQVRQLEPILAPREAAFVARIEEDCLVALSESDAESLSWRLLAAISSVAAPGEHIALALDRSAETMSLRLSLPAAMLDRDDLFAADIQKPGGAGILSPGSFGSGFALRLARAEVRSVGGTLARVEDRLELTLPLLTAAQADSSPEDIVQEAVQPGLP